MTPDQIAHRDRMLSKFAEQFSAKYANGQQEHGGNMWAKPGMLQHAKEEVIDLVAYLYTLEEQLAKRVEAAAGLPPTCYIAGPFRGANSWEMESNIRRAEALALEAWKLGFGVLCPHSNTRFFQGAADDAIWLDGDLALLARCDVVLMTPDWKQSSGATAEHDFAVSRGIAVVYALDELMSWKARLAA